MWIEFGFLGVGGIGSIWVDLAVAMDRKESRNSWILNHDPRDPSG